MFTLPNPKENYIIKTQDGTNDIKCYRYEPSTTKIPDTVIIIAPDAFGVEGMDTHMFASKFGEALGVQVVVMDTFRGKPLLGSCVAMNPKPFDMSVFASAFGVAIADVTHVADELSKKFKTIGFIGFCFNGATACKLAGQSNKISSLVGCYGRIDLKDATAIKKPCFLIFGGDDRQIDEEFAKKLQQDMEEHAKTQGDFPKYLVKSYPRVEHGFVHRMPMGKNSERESANALKDIVDFFNETLKNH